MAGRFTRRKDGDFKVNLSAEERGFLRSICEQMRLMLERGHRDDPVMKRLYPSASLDDPVLAAQLDDMIRDDLTQQRLEAIQRLESTVDATRVSEEDLTSWLAVCNDARLVIGVSINVTEGSRPKDFDAPGDAAAFDRYQHLTFLVTKLVAALSGITQGDLLLKNWRRLVQE